MPKRWYPYPRSLTAQVLLLALTGLLLVQLLGIQIYSVITSYSIHYTKLYDTAQPADQGIDGPIEGLGFPPSGQIQQLIPAQHPLGPLQKHLEQIELGGRQADGDTALVHQFPAGEIQRPVIEAQPLRRRLGLGFEGAAGAA